MSNKYSVTSGRYFAGTITETSSGWIAIAADGTRIGTFRTVQEATRALPDEHELRGEPTQKKLACNRA
jgi:hypothetical protein